MIDNSRSEGKNVQMATFFLSYIFLIGRLVITSGSLSPYVAGHPILKATRGDLNANFDILYIPNSRKKCLKNKLGSLLDILIIFSMGI